MSPHGTVETFVSGHGLDGPADVTFGTAKNQQKTVYVPNLAFPSTGPGPSITSLNVGVPGLPIGR